MHNYGGYYHTKITTYRSESEQKIYGQRVGKNGLAVADCCQYGLQRIDEVLYAKAAVPKLLVEYC